MTTAFVEKMDLQGIYYVSQDGGYFYFARKADNDTNWMIENDNPCVHYVDSGFNPSFDQLDVCEQARDWLVDNYSHVIIRFD